MKSYFGKVLILCACTLCFNVSLYANELFPVSLQQRTDNSTLVAEGTVVSQHSYWDVAHQNIYTSNIIKVYRIFKGTLTEGEIEIVTEGGTVDLVKHVFSSTLSLGLNESGIFFCMPHQLRSVNNGSRLLPSFMVYSSLQGFIVYDTRDRTASDPFTRYITAENLATEIKRITRFEKSFLPNSIIFPPKTTREDNIAVAPVITSLSPGTIPAGTGEILTITGSNFGAVRGTGFVEFRNSNDGGSSLEQPLASDYQSWTDSEIRVKVPSVVLDVSGCAGTGQVRVTNSDPATGTSPMSLVVPYAYSNINDNGLAALPDHIVDTLPTGGYIFRMETSFAANAAAGAAFSRAMVNWTCNTGINWITGTTTSVNSTSADGINIVKFDADAPLPAGILARTTSRYNGCGFVGINPLTWYVIEIDINFAVVPSATLSWEFGPDIPSPGEVDFESVAVHELGHAHQLSHIVIPGAVMHYALTNGQLSRTLSSADISGGNFVTAHSLAPNICGPASMLAGNCVLVPVKLMSFEGSYVSGENKALLTWKTTSETTVSGYQIQRSNDGQQFSDVGFVQGIKSATSNTYTYNDQGLTASKWYYRLAIVNAGGSKNLSSIILIDAANTASRLSVYPNPARTEIILSGTGIELNGSTLELLSADGKSVMNLRFNGNDSNFSKQISVEQLAPGVYFYRLVTSAGTSYKGKFSKIK